MAETQRHVVNILVQGHSFTGKSSLICTFRSALFPPIIPVTRSVDVRNKAMDIDGKAVTLRIWDTVAFNFSATDTQREEFRGTDCCVFVFDLTNAASFTQLDRLYRTYKEFDTARAVPFVLVGNKADREEARRVKWTEAQTWARRHGIAAYFEVSARNNENVAETFAEAARLAVAYQVSHDGHMPRTALA